MSLFTRPITERLLVCRRKVRSCDLVPGLLLAPRTHFHDTCHMSGNADLRAIIDRQNRENATENARLARAQKAALQAATELATRMGSDDRTLRRVILFGSTIPGRHYRPGSDIDLAVEGGDRALLERLAANLSQPVDIIGLDEMRPGIRDIALAEGIVIYEADQDRF